jgi:hypothetical protein
MTVLLSHFALRHVTTVRNAQIANSITKLDGVVFSPALTHLFLVSDLSSFLHVQLLKHMWGGVRESSGVDI